MIENARIYKYAYPGFYYRDLYFLHFGEGFGYVVLDAVCDVVCVAFLKLLAVMCSYSSM